MPTYVYEILGKNGNPTGRRFEIVQSMKDDALTKHAETGEPVRRAIIAPNIAGNWSPLKTQGKLSDRNLERLGFTKYQRAGKGQMERVVGKGGPPRLSADD